MPQNVSTSHLFELPPDRKTTKVRFSDDISVKATLSHLDWSI